MALTEVRIVGQAAEVALGRKRPSSHAVGSTRTEINGTNRNEFTNFG
jgi:hypothetical protein